MALGWDTLLMQHFVTIDWPNMDACLNGRGHWSKRKAIQDRQKQLTAIQCNHLPKCEHKDDIPITVLFCFPDKRARDADNLLAAIKAALDTISKHIKADDSRFWPITMDRLYGEGGKVIITLNY